MEKTTFLLTQNKEYVPDEKSKNYASGQETENEIPKRNITKTVLYASYLRQIFCGLIISSGLAIFSFLVGSTSMLPILLEKDPSQGTQQIQGLASGPILMSIPGSLLAMYLSKFYGPRWIMHIFLLLSFIIYIPLAFFLNLESITVSRFCLFFMVGVFDTIVMPLTVELSEPQIRGLLGALPEIVQSFGMLFTYLTFAFMEGRLAILCNATFVLLAFLGSFIVPESPRWLIQSGNKTEAAKSFARIMGPHRKDQQNHLLEEAISCYLHEEQKPSLREQMKHMTKPKNMKSFLMMMYVFWCRESSGQSAIFFYTLIIFQKANTEIDNFLCTVIVGATRFLSTCFSTLIQDRLGRRRMFIGSIAVSGFSLLVGGLVLACNMKVLSIVPLISVIIFTIMVGFGIAPVPFILLGELIPSEVKFLSTTIIIMFYTFFIFLVVVITPVLIDYINIGVVFMVFAFSNFVNSAVLYFILPESRNKSLTDLENMFI